MKIEININDRIVDFFKRNLKGKKFIMWMGSVIFATSIMVYAAPLILPYTFTEGTVISADEVNANFTALRDKVNELEANVQAAPVGTIVAYSGDTAPAGWLLCNGTDISRTTYSDLYAVVGIKWGAGDLTNTFNLPDLRGRFLRGVDNGAGIDPDAASRIAIHNGGNTGDVIGSYQDDAYLSHNHWVGANVSPYSSVVTSTGMTGNNLYSHNKGSSYSGGSETRPKNAYINYIIKY